MRKVHLIQLNLLTRVRHCCPKDEAQQFYESEYERKTLLVIVFWCTWSGISKAHETPHMRVWMQDAFFDCIVLMPGFLSPCHAWPNSWSIIFGNIYIMCWWSKSVQHVRDKRLSVPPNNAVSTSDHRSSEALHRVYNVTWMWKRSHKHADREYGVCSAWKKKSALFLKCRTLYYIHCCRIAHVLKKRICYGYPRHTFPYSLTLLSFVCSWRLKTCV